MAKFQSLIGMSIGVNLVSGVQFFPSQIIISHNKESCRQAFIGSAADQTGDFFSPLEGANVFGCYMIRQIRDHTGEREEAWQRKQFTVE